MKTTTNFRVQATPSLEAARIHKGFSQRELALMVAGLTGKRLPEPTYNKIEAGERTTSLLLGQAIAKVLGESTTTLFTLQDL